MTIVSLFLILGFPFLEHISDSKKNNPLYLFSLEVVYCDLYEYILVQLHSSI